MNNRNEWIIRYFWIIVFLVGVMSFSVIMYSIIQIVRIIHDISNLQLKLLLIRPFLLAIIVFLLSFLLPFISLFIVKNRTKKNK